MLYLILKACISGVLVTAVSEVAKRSPSLGALIASLPLVSALAMIWLWQETKDKERLAAHAGSTFWLVLPSLPMFLLLPALLNADVGFYPSLLLSCLVTVVLYMGMVWTMGRFGISF